MQSSHDLPRAAAETNSLQTDGRGQTMKLTAVTVRSAGIPPDKREAIYFDDDVPGFGLRIREGGSRSFVFQYKLGTKQRRMALGTATALNFGATRKTAEQLYARVKLGQDPASDKAEGRLRAAETFIVAANQFLDTLRARYRPRAFKEIERHLLKHAKTLHELQLAKIDRRDIATVLVAVTNAAGAVTANRVRTSLSTFYGWVLNRGLAETNPVIGTEKNEEQSRERVLTPSELRIVWSAAGDDHYGSIIKLLALTGQREREIGDLRRSEIHDAAILLAEGAHQEQAPACRAAVARGARHHRGPGATRRPRPDIRPRGGWLFRLVEIEGTIGRADQSGERRQGNSALDVARPAPILRDLCWRRLASA